MGYRSWDWWHYNSTEMWEGAEITAQRWRSSQVALLLLGLWSCDLRSLKRLGRDELPSGCTLRSQPPQCFGNVGANNTLRHGAELQLSPEEIVLFKIYFLQTDKTFRRKDKMSAAQAPSTLCKIMQDWKVIDMLQHLMFGIPNIPDSWERTPCIISFHFRTFI